MTPTEEERPPAADRVPDLDEELAKEAAELSKATEEPTRSFRESIRLLADKRLLIIFLFGIASGYPWLLIGSAMTAWLQESGLSRSAIGFFGSIFGAYAINFLWAPFVDRTPFPILSKLGPRRSWILGLQILMVAATLGLAFTDPEGTDTFFGREVTGLLIVASLALFIAICSATQDVAIDAYRVELIPRHETAVISHGSAMTTCGWWVGYGFLGVVPFMIADLPGWDWGRIYFILAALWVPLMIAVLWAPKSRQKRDRFEKTEQQYEAALADKSGAPSRWQKIVAWLAVTLLEPGREFFRRSGPRLAIFVLIFIFTFKLGEAFLGRMSIVFYKEVGFTDAQIGIFSKGLTGLVTIVFSVVGSIINARFGLIKGLMIGGISMAASNLMFSWIAMVGPHVGLYAAAIVVDGFTTAFSTVAFVAFISFLTSHTYTATQYALMASLGNLGRTLVSATSGVVVDAMGGNWALFFVITALMVLPSLGILVYVAKLMRERIPGWRGGRA